MKNPIRVESPSNIAIIKYMGKKDKNLPLNPSLSMTLSALSTEVEIWELENQENNPPIQWLNVMSQPAQDRVQRHFERCLRELPLLLKELSLDVRPESELKKLRINLKSINRFPTGVGIASSASAFSALTFGFAALFLKKAESLQKSHFSETLYSQLCYRLSELSREGSGSSARSFEGPWVEWKKEGASKILDTEICIPALTDLVMVVSQKPKEISSSQAHARVLTSLEWSSGRVERANLRFNHAKEALRRGDLIELSQVAWDEMMDMHGLFHTATPPFTYWTKQTESLLEELKALRQSYPHWLVTMDAGPNIHVLVPKTETEPAQSLLEGLLKGEILRDEGGSGVRFNS